MSQRIDLVRLGGRPLEAPADAWPHGESRACAATPAGLAHELAGLVEAPSGTALLTWGGSLPLPDPTLLETLLARPGDIWHAGLALGTGSLPRLLDSVRPTWMHHRDPPPEREATSWRLTFEACLLRTEVLRALGPLDDGFESCLGAGLELGHRALRGGAIIRHVPELAGGRATPTRQLPPADEVRFVGRCYGRRWARWALLRACWNRRVTFGAARRLARSAPGRRADLPELRRSVVPRSLASRTLASRTPPSKPAVTVLIPTLDRYEHLETLLAQLAEQSVSPHQVVVVDQTPEARRETGLVERFADLPLEILYRRQAGQCSSRNAGLERATGTHILFLDDDDEIPPDLVARHLTNIERFEAAASCGVADEVGAGDLPAAFRRWRLSDVFPTNNAMIRREILRRSGLFDLAFERGERADADLGMRIYLAGGLSVLDPETRVLHLRAPRGGLRTWGARRKTYAASRKRLWTRHLPSVTEIYLGLRYFTREQVREKLWIAAAATLRSDGPRWMRVLRAVTGSLLLPWTALVLQQRSRRARRMLRRYPQIPSLEPASSDPPSFDAEPPCTV